VPASNQLQTLLLANILDPRFKSVIIFSRNYVQVRRNYGRQPSNQLRGVRGASEHACSTGLSLGRHLMPMTARCGGAKLCRGATTVRHCRTRGEWWKEHRVCASAAVCEGVDENSAASACEGVDENARAWTKTRGNPDSCTGASSG
jgi:hypothetical protein